MAGGEDAFGPEEALDAWLRDAGSWLTLEPADDWVAPAFGEEAAPPLPPERRRPFDLRRANPVGALAQMRRYPVVLGLFAITSVNAAYLASVPPVEVTSSSGWAWNARSPGIATEINGPVPLPVPPRTPRWRWGDGPLSPPGSE